MTHRHHTSLGLALLVAGIAFAFGENAARAFVGAVIIGAAVLFAWVMLLIVAGKI